MYWPCCRDRRNYNKDEDEAFAVEVERETRLQRGFPPMYTKQAQPEAHAMQPPVFMHQPESDSRTVGRDIPQFQERSENYPNLTPYQPQGNGHSQSPSQDIQRPQQARTIGS
ncbi:hypothetical protein GALMADRAFT_145283 [Galerina marginata CBS 339.88]|uniref:Uncharacterized protein n=1 Tax=Galerina marginata (strain CBS 339.88) TaxID=685588 RepID=A0A067SSZ3_GALM3|nr:hypothetical protein GALMADRAFT_145283 [Galerina marginata CBS 339.88]